MSKYCQKILLYLLLIKSKASLASLKIRKIVFFIRNFNISVTKYHSWLFASMQMTMHFQLHNYKAKLISWP